MKRGKGKTEAGREEKKGRAEKNYSKAQEADRRTEEAIGKGRGRTRGKRYKGWEREDGSGERRENKFPYSYLS